MSTIRIPELGEYVVSSVWKNGNIQGDELSSEEAERLINNTLKEGILEDEERLFITRNKEPFFEARRGRTWYGKARIEIVRHPAMSPIWKDWDEANRPQKEVKTWSRVKAILEKWLLEIAYWGGLLSLNLGGLWFTMIYMGSWATMKSLWVLMFKAVGFMATAWVGIKLTLFVLLILLTAYCIYKLTELGWNVAWGWIPTLFEKEVQAQQNQE